MSASVWDQGLRPFSQSGYEILDEDLKTRGEVVIWSVVPLAPRVGDVFIIENGGKLHEIAVAELCAFKGGWTARCKVVGVVA